MYLLRLIKMKLLCFLHIKKKSDFWSEEEIKAGTEGAKKFYTIFGLNEKGERND